MGDLIIQCTYPVFEEKIGRIRGLIDDGNIRSTTTITVFCRQGFSRERETARNDGNLIRYNNIIIGTSPQKNPVFTDFLKNSVKRVCNII